MRARELIFKTLNCPKVKRQHDIWRTSDVMTRCFECGSTRANGQRWRTNRKAGKSQESRVKTQQQLQQQQQQDSKLQKSLGLIQPHFFTHVWQFGIWAKVVDSSRFFAPTAPEQQPLGSAPS